MDPSRGTFVADHAGDVCGCAFADVERDPRGVMYGRISNVNIAESCQGHGIGSQLVDEAILFLSALNISWIWANVNQNNELMLKLFERRGFKRMLKVMVRDIDPFNPYPQVDLVKNEIRYRAMIELDIPQVKQLIKELAEIFNEPFDSFWFDLSVEKYFQVPSSKIFIATRGAEILGLTFVDVQKNPFGNSYGYISNIMIKNEARGLGIGTHLLQLATSFLANLNVPRIWGNVNYENASMQKMFEKQGYKEKFIVMVKKTDTSGAC